MCMALFMMRFTVRTERLTTIGGYIAGFALLFLIWHLAAVYLVKSTLFPPPGPLVSIAESVFLQRTAILWENPYLLTQSGRSAAHAQSDGEAAVSGWYAWYWNAAQGPR